MSSFNQSQIASFRRSHYWRGMKIGIVLTVAFVMVAEFIIYKSIV